MHPQSVISARSMIHIVALLSMTACTKDVSMFRSPKSLPDFEMAALVGTVGVSSLDVQALEELSNEVVIERAGHSLRHGYSHADMNSRPIHLWFSRNADGKIDQIQVSGHAEEECCAKVSHELTSLAEQTPGLASRWLSYGVASLDAAGDATAQAAFADFHASIAHVQSQSTCEGQIVIHEVESHQLERQLEQVAVLAAQTCEVAEEANRVIAVRVPVQSLPVFSPLLAASTGQPIRIEMSAADLAVPKSLQKGVTVSGVAHAIREVTAAIRDLDDIISTLDEYGNEIGPDKSHRWSELSLESVQMSADVATIEAAVEVANATIDTVEKWCTNEVKIAEVLGLDVVGQQRVCREVGAIWSANVEVVRRLPDSGTAEVEYVEIGDIKLVPNEFPDLREELNEDRDARKQALAALRKNYIATVRSDGLPNLVDALLRGWPATFSNPKIEDSFDKWAIENQERVWQIALAALARSYGYGHGVERLLNSNVYFVVEESGSGAYTIIPHYFHDSDFYLVCEPGDTFATHESFVSDQNLLNAGGVP